MDPGYEVVPASPTCKRGATPSRARGGFGTLAGKRATADETRTVGARGGWIVPRTAEGIAERRATRM
jgi:hypothetical protein